MNRFELNTPSALRIEVRDATGALVDATGNDVSVAIVDGAGTEVVSNAAAAHDGVGLYHVNLPAAVIGKLDVYRADVEYSLAGDTYTPSSYFRTIGRHYCTLADLRSFGQQKTLADPDEFPDELLIAKRDLAEELLEEETGKAFSPQAARFVVSGMGQVLLRVSATNLRRVVSASIDGVALTQTELDALMVFPEVVRRDELWNDGVRNIALWIEYGMDEPPRDIRESTMHIVRDRTEDNTMLDERATSVTNAAGTQRIAVAGRDGPTGIPFVDATIDRYAPDEDELVSVKMTTSFGERIRP